MAHSRGLFGHARGCKRAVAPADPGMHWSGGGWLASLQCRAHPSPVHRRTDATRRSPDREHNRVATRSTRNRRRQIAKLSFQVGMIGQKPDQVAFQLPAFLR